MNRIPQVFLSTDSSELLTKTDVYKKDGWRFAQLCGSNLVEGVELLYTFSKGQELENLVLVVPPKSTLPSISGIYLEAFVYENETHDLFGISFDGLAIDFGGTFFEVSEESPMFEVVEPREPKPVKAVKKETGDEAAPKEELKASETEGSE